jgi:uncharacterized protein (DUF849 family)
MQNEGSRKIIVAVAPVGAEIKPPSENPLTPEDVAGEVIACAEAGAGMVHLHVRDREGNQTENISDFSKTLDIIRQSSDIIIQGSTGGLSTFTLEQRCVAVNDPRVEVASLNMGSVNFGEDVYINRFYLTTMLKVDIDWGVVHDNMMDLSLLATAIGLGATVVRVGFEDSVYYAPGIAAKHNQELVKKIVSLIDHIGLEVASPSEARTILGIV